MENREFESFLTQVMSPEHSSVESPDPLLVFEARQAVLKRRKPARNAAARLGSLAGLLLSALRLQHLGITVMLVTSGLLYISELTNSPRHRETSAYDHVSVITATNSTISVISSTMLTSIPTLRN